MSKKGKASSNANNNDFKAEEVLQAVLLADSFVRVMRPITWEKPKVMQNNTNNTNNNQTNTTCLNINNFWLCFWHQKQTKINKNNKNNSVFYHW